MAPEDMMGNLHFESNRAVSSSGKTDAEGGGGYSFIFHRRMRKGQPEAAPEDEDQTPSAEEKNFDPGKPVEVKLSSAAVHYSGHETAKENSPHPDDSEKNTTGAEKKGGRVNITL